MRSVPDTYAAAWASRYPELSQIQDRLQSYVNYVCARLRFSNRQSQEDFRVRFIDQGRIKTLESIHQKLDRYKGKYPTPWNLEDMVGMRVVVISESDADRLASEFCSDEECPLQEVTAKPVESEVGYRALHVAGWFRDTDPPVGCEIQIRTELQDLWAAVSDHDLYKKDKKDVTSEVTAKATSLAHKLAEIDREMQEIREAAREIPDYVPARKLSDDPEPTDDV